MGPSSINKDPAFGGAHLKPSSGPIPPMKPHSQQLMDAQQDL